MTNNEKADFIQAKISKGIEKQGVNIVSVFDPLGRQPTFTYTVGLFVPYGFEVIVIGLNVEYSYPLLMDVFTELRNGWKPVIGESDEGKFANHPCLFMECLDRSVRGYVIQADAWAGEPVRVLQLVMADRKGRLPTDPLFNTAYMSPKQPLLY